MLAILGVNRHHLTSLDITQVAKHYSEASHIWIDTDFMDPDDLDLYRWGIMGSFKWHNNDMLVISCNVVE